MTLPVAHIGHQTSDRIRIKIPSRKGETAYFSEIREMLLKHVSVERVEANPMTGSLLLKGVQNDAAAAIASVGEANALFNLDTRPSEVETLSSRISAPFHDLSRSIGRFSGGELDLPGMAFLSLIGVGIYQFTRGNLTAPPWYVAFWYALGIFTQSLMDKKQGLSDVHDT